MGSAQGDRARQGAGISESGLRPLTKHLTKDTSMLPAQDLSGFKTENKQLLLLLFSC